MFLLTTTFVLSSSWRSTRYEIIKFMSCICVTSSCYAHLQTHHTHSTSLLRLLLQMSKSRFKFTYLLVPRFHIRASPPRSMSPEPSSCYCSCGDVPDPGRKAHPRPTNERSLGTLVLRSCMTCSTRYCFKINYSDRNLETLDSQIIIRNTVQSPLNFI